jgi:hypothetical protein
MEGIFIASAVIGMLQWAGVPGPLDAMRQSLPPQNMVIQQVPVVEAPLYTNDPMFRSCTRRNPCFVQ